MVMLRNTLANEIMSGLVRYRFIFRSIFNTNRFYILQWKCHSSNYTCSRVLDKMTLKMLSSVFYWSIHLLHKLGAHMESMHSARVLPSSFTCSHHSLFYCSLPRCWSCKQGWFLVRSGLPEWMFLTLTSWIEMATNTNTTLMQVRTGSQVHKH